MVPYPHMWGLIGDISRLGVAKLGCEGQRTPSKLPQDHIKLDKSKESQYTHNYFRNPNVMSIKES